MRQDVTLADRHDLEKRTVLLNGTQALVRLMLIQKARDRAAGLNTAGYVTGYRGSPLGAVDMAMNQAEKALAAADVRFQPGLNEDLAVTALWGTQQAELRGEGRHDGVFGLFYGKGPGIDRSGDAMRHANMAGTSPHGGVLMAMGDDHTGESSTVCHQSDWAMVDAGMPVLSPAGVQEILDFGVYGYALSRFAGVWAGLKLMKDTVEVTAVVDGRPDRMILRRPGIVLPEGGLNIRLGDHWTAQEARLFDQKKAAAEAFANANEIDRRLLGKPGAEIGFVAAGKNWLDLVHALSLLGIDAPEAARLGITAYKIGQTWPLDIAGLRSWSEGLNLIVVVEEKRKLIEGQIKQALYHDRHRCRVYGAEHGGHDGAPAETLFPSHHALDPVMIARRIGALLIAEGRDTDRMRSALQAIEKTAQDSAEAPIAARLPYFCAGCPHNTSTRVPEGSRAYAGIGCHFMAQWMDRETSGFTHMGAEGANWIGEAPFSTRAHVFQNIGDGTYNHSGVQAIRFALAAGTNITYKILFNDAVAMTGGQANDGGLSPARIAAELVAMGVRNVAVVHDGAEGVSPASLPDGVAVHHRDELPQVQDKFRHYIGVSVILYVQTCAAEKRRRRKRGTFPDPDRRIFINPDICEGCGDCGVQSNCVAIVPAETELGRKRAIDQSACNKDFSCLKGFCPSFVTLDGAVPRKQARVTLDIGPQPEPRIARITGTHNLVITGIGGTGVVTLGAVLAMAAHLDGKGAAMMEMAGLAQKGGAVHIHCRLAETPDAISAIRVAPGEADALIGGDLVVSAGAATLGLLRTGRTAAVVNSHEIVTGDFTRDPKFRIPTSHLAQSLEARIGDRLTLLDGVELARAAMGDTIYSNMIVFGAAWQKGLVPVSRAAIRQAIALNGAAVEANQRAFEIGRWAAVNPDEAARAGRADAPDMPATPEDRIAYRAAHLTAYQSARLARKYRRAVARFKDPALKDTVARGYHKVLAYKDEYEVARLLLDTEAQAQQVFDGDFTVNYHLSPPILARKNADGRPAKRRFGPAARRLFALLARMKRLRGTPFDPFGHTAERRMERALIRDYEADLDLIETHGADCPDTALALAELPLDIRGFGPVKQANADRAAARRLALRAALAAGPDSLAQAAE